MSDERRRNALTVVERAIAECKRWGIAASYSKDLPVDAVVVFSAPQHDGGITADGSICLRPLVDKFAFSPERSNLSEYDRNSHFVASAILHELAHLLVYRASGKSPRIHDELSLLAIEHEAVRRLRVRWSEWMNDYGVDDDSETLGLEFRTWTELSAKRKSELLSKSAEFLVNLGLMKDGKPSYVAPPFKFGED